MREILWVLFCLSLALVVRLDFLNASDYRIDSDEAIVGLMAKHIVEGGDIPVFYYGQHYMGSFEALVAAVGFKLFGPSEIVLKSIPLSFSLIFLLLVYFLVKIVHSRAAAQIAIFLGALPPATLVIWSTKARGGFIEILCIGTAALITTVYWCQKHSQRPNFLIATGLLLGFGWWVNNQIIYFMLPVGFVVLAVSIQEKVRIKQIFRRLLMGMVAFFVGGAPFWIYNFENDFVSFDMFGGASGSDVFKHFLGLIETAMPILLGGKRYWHTQDVFPGSSLFAWSILILALLIIAFYRRRDILNLFLFRINSSRPVEILLLLLFAAVSVFVFSSFGYLSQAPRYLLPAYAGILAIYSIAVVLIAKRSKIVSSFMIAAWLLLFASSGYAGGRAIPGEPFVFEQQRVNADHKQLINWLEKQNVSWVRTNYWIGYRLSFETDEKVKFLIFGEPYQTRIDRYREASDSVDRSSMPLILVPAQAKYVKSALEAQGFLYQQKVLSGYVVIYDIRPGESGLVLIELSSINAKASVSQQYSALAIDRDPLTRWRSAEPQKAGMKFSIFFDQPQSLRAIKYELGKWPHDYPRGLQIDIEHSDGSQELLYNPEFYHAVRYYLQGDSTLSFFKSFNDVNAVHLVQTGEHSLFDWSIAELAFYR